MAADPNETQRLRMMISQFRVSELTSLLQSQSRSKTGRKRELMDRALELLEGPISDSLRNKIVELDQHRNPAGRQPVSWPVDYGLGVGGAGDYPGADLLGSNSYSTPGPFPKVEPGVKFRPLAFFDQKEVVQKASKVPGNGTRVAGTQFYIRIPDTAIKLFVQGQTANREMYSFLIRFADLTPVNMGENILADEIPTALKLKVNDREPELPPHIPPSKAGVDPKRQKRPIQITPQIRSLVERANNHGQSHVDVQISCSWKEDSGTTRQWAITVELSEQISSDTLLERVKQTSIPKEDTIGIVKEKLNSDADVAMTSIRVNLLCPVGCSRMTTPTRTKKCNHLQCFDANLFLKMNEKKPTWNCPVCHRNAYFNELIVDEYFIEICQASKTDEVDFQEDGGWKEYYTPKEREKLEKRERSKKDNAVVIHDITLADSGDEDDDATPTAGISSTVRKLSVSADPDTIMVISSSEDEDPNPPKRQRLAIGPNGSKSPSQNFATPDGRLLGADISGVSRESPSKSDRFNNRFPTPDLLQGHSLQHQHASPTTVTASTGSAVKNANSQDISLDSILAMANPRQLELALGLFGQNSQFSPFSSHLTNNSSSANRSQPDVITIE